MGKKTLLPQNSSRRKESDMRKTPKPDSSKPSSLLGRQTSEMHHRAFIIFTICTIVAAVIIGKLFYLQIIKHEDYKNLVLQQMLYETPIDAKRGTIKDRNGVILATNYTTERIFIDPHNMVVSKDAERTEAIRKFIAEGLSEILEVEYDFVYTEAQKSKYRDRTIKKNVEKEIADKVRAFINDNADNELFKPADENEKDMLLSGMIHLAETTTRVYPYGSLASHVIGFCGTDGGLYGLEYQYDSVLSGVSGNIFAAKNGIGGAMPYNYETIIDAQNGANVITTLDYKIQSFLQKYLEEAAVESGAISRACGIIMNPKTGEIYAMATYPYYDLNSPRTLPDYYDNTLAAYASLYGEDSEKYLQKKSELLFSTWNNKCLTDTYEPGSTSKIFTTAIALEENLSTVTETFTCLGSYTVSGWSKPIKCHKVTGHGTLTFAGALQQSCNPVMMRLAERIGISTFCDYFSAFGLDSKTGIDLPGEADSIYTTEENMTGVDLAVYSFGQRYNVTAIQQITAVASVANGGTLVTPHIVKEIIDDDGNTLASFGTTAVRQVVSEDVAETISQILEEGVSGNGGAKNAYVKGYKVAAKTGTSEKGTNGARIASTVAYAPADDPEVICILVVDEPTIGSLYGSSVAAPYVSKILGDVLPYLGIEPEYTEKELEEAELDLPNFRGMSLDEAILRLLGAGLSYEIVGNGTSVIEQTPPSGSTIMKENGKVILYTSENAEEKTAIVPSVLGMTAEKANKTLTDAGFNILISGNTQGGTVATKQSIAGGTTAEKGTVITVEFRYIGTD